MEVFASWRLAQLSSRGRPTRRPARRERRVPPAPPAPPGPAFRAPRAPLAPPDVLSLRAGL